MAREKLYKNLTLQQKYILFFTAPCSEGGMGCREVESKTNKYRVVEGRHADFPDATVVPRFWFLGKSGGIRVNNRNAMADSRSITASTSLEIRFRRWEELYLTKLDINIRASGGTL